MIKEQLVWYPTINTGYITKDMWKYIHNIQHRMNKYNLVDTNISYMLDRIFGYKLRTTTDNCGGYCAFTRKVIAYNRNSYDIDSIELKHVIAHEVGHIIQSELEIFDTTELLLSNRYHIELQAESLGSIIFDIMFPNDKKDNDEFDGYFHKKSLIFLRDWYGDGVQNDLVDEIKIMK